MTIHHDTFTLERTFDATVADVWRHWVDPELRQKWFRAPNGWEMLERKNDFKVGGGEVLRGRMPDGTKTSFSSNYYVIQPERCIVSAYIMHINDALLSMTQATMDVTPSGKSTLLRYTEQGVYFEGEAKAAQSRKAGTTWHLDNLKELFEARR
jgi:uncharacterized protein YndB with AHSA1/START domain